MWLICHENIKTKAKWCLFGRWRVAGCRRGVLSAPPAAARRLPAAASGQAHVLQRRRQDWPGSHLGLHLQAALPQGRPQAPHHSTLLKWVLVFELSPITLQVCGTRGPVGSSNILERNLPFDLSFFKSLLQIEVIAFTFSHKHWYYAFFFTI